MTNLSVLVHGRCLFVSQEEIDKLKKKTFHFALTLDNAKR